MTTLNRFSYGSKIILAALVNLLLFLAPASARKIYPTKGGVGDGGKYYNGATAGINPGDTIVLTAAQNPWAYFALENLNGTASQPIVVINEGGVVDITNGFNITSCQYLKITGSGSSDQYGFKSESGSGVGITISKRSANMEVERLYFNNKTYGFWVKQEADCDPSAQYPNWVLDNFSLHDNKITNMGQEAMYLGSTDPNGTRGVTCNGVTIYPKPLRLGNIKVYNNIIYHTNRGGIQLSGAQFGNNEIYNNNISNVGYEYDPAQGNGIVLGGYSHAYVHDNTVNNTFSSGIFSLGSGLARIENNKIDNSGNLDGRSTMGMASIMIDSRLTNPVENTSFQIKNNTVGANTDLHVRVYNSFNTFNTDNVICSNMPVSGNYTASIASGIIYTGCAGAVNLPPTANAGLPQTISLPVSSVQVTGTGLDPDGTIAGYNWKQVSGPAQYAITNPSSAQTTITNLVQGTYTFRLTVTDNGGATGYSDVNITVNGTGSTTTSTVSSISLTSVTRVEAESYSSQLGTQLENTADAGGGQDVAYIDNGDVMDYGVNVGTSGTYNVSFRVASQASGAQLQVRKLDGSVLSTVNIPNTGGWQTWQTVTVQVPLSAGIQTLRLVSTSSASWNINWMEYTGVSGAPLPSTPTTTTSSVALPGKVEAESYANQNGTQLENTSDAGGGQNLGYIDNGDWMDYSVNPSASGSYTVSFRVASQASGGQLQLRKADGTTLATVSVPNTGGWQTWQTVSAVVNLSAGAQTLRVVSTASAGWNINWIDFASGGTTTSGSGTTTTTSTGTALPGKVEAESYANQNGTQLENTSDAGGGQNLGYIDNGDWMDYSVNPSASGSYTVNFRVATQSSGGQLQLRKSDGTTLATVSVPNTGGWQTWQTVSAVVNLSAGAQTLRVVSTASAGWNINWIDFASGGSTTTTPTAPSGSTTRIEAESFSNQSGTQTEGTSDAGGGQDVGYIDNGDWMDYSVNPSTSGSYTINFRVATQSSGGQFQLRKADGTVLATVAVPNTGGWQTWQTVSAVVSLSAGQQTLRIVSTASANWNINWLEMVSGGSTSSGSTTTTSSQRIEAEKFSNQSGTQTEGTSDAGGGQDVGYIDNGDWMDYSVNVPSSATYTVSFRVATQQSGGQLQLRKADGTVLATVSVPNTGGWQTWQTVSANVTLAGGTQTLRIVSTASPNWNINWFELASGSTAALSTGSTSETATLSTTASMSVYPNPVTDKFVLEVNNGLTGALKAQLYDMNGGLQKEFSLTKSTTGAVQFYLSIGTLPAGTYVLKASMSGWSDSTQVVKQ